MNILELVERARRAGVRVTTSEPVIEMPDTLARLGIPMDPELAALYQVTNGCRIGNMHIYGVGEWHKDIVKMNDYVRDIGDDVPVLQRVLVCARLNIQANDLAMAPVHADDRGRYPVVIVDTNEEAFIMPLASTLTRGLELLVDNEIAFARDQGEYEEPFPYSAVQTVRQDTRLLQLIENDAFASIGDEHTLDREWCDLLLGSDDC